MIDGRAAVIHEVGEQWSIENISIADPGPNEILVRMTVAGLCHSDDHTRNGDLTGVKPQIGGHEGAGIVEKVGPGTTLVKEGDLISTLWIPSCGFCKYCVTGRSYICNAGRDLADGLSLDGTPRRFLNGRGVGGNCRVGSFGNWAVLHETQAVTVPEGVSDIAAALVSCGVPTGWGAVVNGARVRPGDVVVIMGAGGIGMNAVQAAARAGAHAVLVVDPVAFKRDTAMTFGATEVFASVDDARATIAELTFGQGADAVIVAVGDLDPDIIGEAWDVTAKGGICCSVAIGPDNPGMPIRPTDLWAMTKTLTGALYGNCNPRVDIPRLLAMYQAGQLKIDELVTRTYTLDQINTAYDDLRAGKNIRGVVIHEH